jgi:phage portal protein BeeE
MSPPNDHAALTVATPSALGRAWAAVGRALGLTATVETTPEVVAGGDYAASAAVPSRYSPEVSLSAIAHPVVYACIEAITSDLAGLPIRVMRGEEVVEGHWLHTMLANTGLSQRTWRKLMIRDQVLVGRSTSVLLISSLRKGQPIGVRWQHPNRVKPVPGADGTPIGYEIGLDRLIQYSPEQVIATLSLGYLDSPDILTGIGATQVLHADLTADEALAKAAARAASAGRPSALYRPRGDGAHWAPTQVAIIKDTITSLFTKSDGGVAVLGTANGELDILGWAPREMEGPQQRAWIRGTVMAVLGVPPVRLGVDGANTWATSDAQMTAYWTQLQGTVAPLDEALTALVRRVDGDPTLTVEHAFDGVPALQVAQSAVLDRIGKHIANGMSPASAYAYEGWEVAPDAFGSAPVPQPAPGAAPAPAPADDDTPDDEDGSGPLAELGDDINVALGVLTDPDATAEDKAAAVAELAGIADELAGMA